MGPGGAAIEIPRDVPETENEVKLPNKQNYFGYLKGFLTGMMNPLQIGWWITAGISVMNSQGIEPFYFFYPGIILYLIIFSIIVKKSYLKWGIKFEMAASVFSSAILFIFGIYFFLILAVNLIIV